LQEREIPTQNQIQYFLIKRNNNPSNIKNRSKNNNTDLVKRRDWEPPVAAHDDHTPPLGSFFPARITMGPPRTTENRGGEMMEGDAWPPQAVKEDKLPSACMPYFDAGTSKEGVATIGGRGRCRQTQWRGACRATVDGGA
jgi:hypothetical protein